METPNLSERVHRDANALCTVTNLLSSQRNSFTILLSFHSHLVSQDGSKPREASVLRTVLRTWRTELRQTCIGKVHFIFWAFNVTTKRRNSATSTTSHIGAASHTSIHATCIRSRCSKICFAKVGFHNGIRHFQEATHIC